MKTIYLSNNLTYFLSILLIRNNLYMNNYFLYVYLCHQSMIIYYCFVNFYVLYFLQFQYYAIDGTTVIGLLEDSVTEAKGMSSIFQ